MKKFNISKGLVIGLLTLALCLTCFAAVKVSADDAVKPPKAVSATYNAVDNSVVGASAGFVYVLKGESGNKIKASDSAVELDDDKIATMTALGIKSVTKDVYLYVCDAKFAEDTEGIDANLVIKASSVKKLVVSINYAAAGDSSKKPLTAKAVDSAKAESTVKEGELYWKDSASDAVYAVSTSFTGETLASKLATGDTLSVFKLGVSGKSGKAEFSSAAVKVKVPAAGKAVKVKIDVAKGSIALKNGFDFGLATKNADDEYEVTTANWLTILPVLKTATKTKLADSIIPTSAYYPVSKKEDSTLVNAAYTQYKLKALTIDYLVDRIAYLSGNNIDMYDPEGFVIGVRKSATEKKPATLVTYVEIKAATKAPIVYTQDKVDDQYLVSTTTDFAKKGLIVGTIANYPGTKSNVNNSPLATTGFDSTFAIDDAEDAYRPDGNAKAYEYCVVSTADYYATDSEKKIDWTTVAWKKIDPAKTKITSKLKTSYQLMSGKDSKKSVTLAAGPKDTLVNYYGYIDGDNNKLTAAGQKKITTLLLVRRAGVKASSIIASAPITLFVGTVGDDVCLFTTQSIGDPAQKYTLQFAKYYPAAGKKAAGWYIDESLSKTGWALDTASAITLELDELSNGEYYSITGTEAPFTFGSETKQSSQTQYEFALTRTATTKTLVQQVKTLAVREYAKVVVKSVVSGVEETEYTYAVYEGGAQTWNGYEELTTPLTTTQVFVGSDFPTITSMNAPVIGEAGSAARPARVILDTTKINDSKYKFKDTVVAVNSDKGKAKIEHFVVPSTAEIVVEIPWIAQYSVSIKSGVVSGENANGLALKTKADAAWPADSTDAYFFNDKDAVEFKLATASTFRVTEVAYGDTILKAKDGVYTVKINKENVGLDVTVKKEHTLTIGTAYTSNAKLYQSDGTTELTNSSKYVEGDTVKFKVTPSTGRRVTAVKIGNTVLEADSKGFYTVEFEDADIELDVLTVEICTVNFSDGSGYTVKVAEVNSGKTVDKGSKINITVTYATAPEKDKVVTIKVGGSAVTTSPATADGSNKVFTAEYTVNADVASITCEVTDAE